MRHQLPDVSVVMSTHNDEIYVEKAINSILNQTFKNFEFVIIDDYSEDETLNIIKDYDNKKFNLVINDKNIGLAVSLNKGIKLAKGKYVARMDADDISASPRLATQKKFLDENPDVVCVATLSILIDESDNIICYGRPYKKNVIVNNLLLKNNLFSHGSVMFRRSVFNSVGGYRDEFECAQDYDLWLRFMQVGNIAIINEHLYMRRIRRNNISIKKLKQQKFFEILARELHDLRMRGSDDYKYLIIRKQEISSCRKDDVFSEVFYDYYMGLQLLKGGKATRAREILSKKSVLVKFKFKAVLLLFVSLLPNKMITKLRTLYWILKDA